MSAHWTYHIHSHLCPTSYSSLAESSEALEALPKDTTLKQCPTIERGKQGISLKILHKAGFETAQQAATFKKKVLWPLRHVPLYKYLSHPPNNHHCNFGSLTLSFPLYTTSHAPAVHRPAPFWESQINNFAFINFLKVIIAVDVPYADVCSTPLWTKLPCIGAGDSLTEFKTMDMKTFFNLTAILVQSNFEADLKPYIWIFWSFLWILTAFIYFFFCKIFLSGFYS